MAEIGVQLKTAAKKLPTVYRLMYPRRIHRPSLVFLPVNILNSCTTREHFARPELVIAAREQRYVAYWRQQMRTTTCTTIRRAEADERLILTSATLASCSCVKNAT